MHCHGCNNPKKAAMNRRYVVVSSNCNGDTMRHMFFCNDCALEVDKKRDLEKFNLKGCFRGIFVILGIVAIIGLVSFLFASYLFGVNSI